MDPSDKLEIFRRHEHDLEHTHRIAPRRRADYAGTARRWWMFTGGRPFDPERATTVAVDEFLADTGAESPARIADIVRGVRYFYRFANAYGLSDLNPTTEAAARCDLDRHNMPEKSPRGKVLEEWATAMRRRGLADGTIATRLPLVRRWWSYCRDPFDPALGHRDVDAFVDGLKLSSANSRYATISHLHQFYNWARRHELCTSDPTELVERPRTNRTLPRPINDVDLTLALTLAEPTMRAALLLACGSGLRACEIARLRWEDLDDRAVRVMGKGSKERVVPLHPAARDALELIDRTDALVFPWRGTRRSKTAEHSPGVYVSHRANSYLKSIGVNATLHQLRHWCATQALRTSGGDLRAVQEILGHASPATTAIYTKVMSDHLDDVVRNIPLPVAALDMEAAAR